MSGGSQSEGASNSVSPASSVALSNPSSSQTINNNAPKYGTLVPNRVFVGGISPDTSEAELAQLFSKYGSVKATKIIGDRAGISKGYGFVTFESEEEVKFLIKEANTNVIELKGRRLNIAPAIKKQLPFSRSFDANSPPPNTPSIYFHNGMPYTFQNGMAFFTPTPHQTPIATMPPSADVYSSYGPTQNTAPAPYGTPLLVPTHQPVFMPQNFSYQPMPMSNGAPHQFIYASSGSPNSNSGSPMAGNPENPPLPAPITPHFYPQHYPHEAFYPQQHYYVSYSYSGDYESQDQQNASDDRSSNVSTPHTDMSDRSSNRSPAVSPFLVAKANSEQQLVPRSETPINKPHSTMSPPVNSNTDSQCTIPVVSWQNLKNNGEERELHIRDGRRSFYPAIPPPAPPRPEVIMYPHPQPSFPGGYPSPVFQQQSVQVVMGTRGPRQMVRGRQRFREPVNHMPIIPKFPTSFNNNNHLAMNKNIQEKKVSEVNCGRSQRYNARGRGATRVHHHHEPIPCNPNPNLNPTNSYVPIASPSPQMIPGPERQYASVERPVMMANSAPRWSSPPIAPHTLAKRMVLSKRQNGCTSNLGAANNTNCNRLTRKCVGGQESDGDVGGGGDAQAIAQLPMSAAAASNNPEVTSKMQTLSLSS